MNEYEEQLKQQAEYNKQLEALETKAKTAAVNLKPKSCNGTQIKADTKSRRF